MDEADITSERLAREMEALLARRAATGPKPSGQCLWCGEPIDPPRRWCSVECRDDWEKRHHAR